MLSSYNGEKYIADQIQSILNQENADHITLYIRDDGSSDNTVNIINDLMNENQNIHLLKGDNVGLVRSFFSLLEICVHEVGFDYYSFCDQDDYWKTEKLSVAVNALQEKDNSKPLMYSSCSEIVDENLNDKGSVTQKNLKGITFFNSAIQNFCPGHNQVINHALAELIVNNTSNFQNIYSQDLWITNVAAVTGEIVFDNIPHTLYRQHSENQLSFGKSKEEWFKDHLNRLKRNECKKIAIQLRQFASDYSKYLKLEEIKEIDRFFSSQKNWGLRLVYISKSKLYRQKSYETLAFKFLYLFGQYNI